MALMSKNEILRFLRSECQKIELIGEYCFNPSTACSAGRLFKRIKEDYDALIKDIWETYSDHEEEGQ